MTFIGKLFAADPQRVGPTAKRTMVGSLVALVLIFAPGGVAAAGSASDTQGQIAALQQQIAAGAASIHTATEDYQQASLQAASLAEQEATDAGTLASMRTAMSRSVNTLRGEALQSYTGQQSSNTYASLGGSADPAVRAEYLVVAGGNVSDSLDQLKVQSGRVQLQRQIVTQEQQANSAALRQAASARASALAQASGEQARLSQLQSILQGQVAAQAAAQAAAERSAAAQQTTAERARPAPEATSAAPSVVARPSTSSARPSTQGAPVNGGLVASVRDAVSPAAVSPAAAAPPAPTPAPPASAPAPTPAPAPPPAPLPPPVAAPPASGGGGSGGNWLRLRECESGGNYAEDTGNGFFGAYQFSQSTWSDLGYPGRPDQVPAAVQDDAAMRLQAQSGWGQWPACSAALGLS